MWSAPQKKGNGYFVRSTDPTYVTIDDATFSDDFKTISSPSLNEIMGKYDTVITDAAKEHKLEWFGRELADSTLNRQYQKSVVDDTLDVKIVKGMKLWIGRGTTKKVGEFPDDLNAEQSCNVVLELVGIWFLQKAYGGMWRIVQTRQAPPKIPKKEPLPEYMFSDDEDDDDNETDEDVESFFPMQE